MPATHQLKRKTPLSARCWNNNSHNPNELNYYRAFYQRKGFVKNPASRFNLIPIIRGACSAFDPQISKSQYRAECDKTKVEEFLSKNIYIFSTKTLPLWFMNIKMSEVWFNEADFVRRFCSFIKRIKLLKIFRLCLTENLFGLHCALLCYYSAHFAPIEARSWKSGQKVRISVTTN